MKLLPSPTETLSGGIVGVYSYPFSMVTKVSLLPADRIYWDISKSGLSVIFITEELHAVQETSGILVRLEMLIRFSA